MERGRSLIGPPDLRTARTDAAGWW